MIDDEVNQRLDAHDAALAELQERMDNHCHPTGRYGDAHTGDAVFAPPPTTPAADEDAEKWAKVKDVWFQTDTDDYADIKAGIAKAAELGLVPRRELSPEAVASGKRLDATVDLLLSQLHAARHWSGEWGTE